MAVSTEPSLTPPPSQPPPLPDAEPLNIAFTPGVPVSKSGEILQQSGFKLNQTVLSLHLQHNIDQASAHTVFTLPSLHPKPIPISLNPGDASLDPWALLGGKQPKVPASLALVEQPEISQRAREDLRMGKEPESRR